MNRRTAAVLSTAVAGTILLTGCGSLGSTTKTNPKVSGMVVETEQELSKSGKVSYQLTITTDRKSIRRKVNRGTKNTEINVSSNVYTQCAVKMMYKNGKCK